MEYSTLGWILAGVAIIGFGIFLYKQNKKSAIVPGGTSVRTPDHVPTGPKGIYDDSTGPKA